MMMVGIERGKSKAKQRGEKKSKTERLLNSIAQCFHRLIISRRCFMWVNPHPLPLAQTVHQQCQHESPTSFN
jgi:hypothetical protein